MRVRVRRSHEGCFRMDGRTVSTMKCVGRRDLGLFVLGRITGPHTHHPRKIPLGKAPPDSLRTGNLEHSTTDRKSVREVVRPRINLCHEFTTERRVVTAQRGLALGRIITTTSAVSDVMRHGYSGAKQTCWVVHETQLRTQHHAEC